MTLLKSCLEPGQSVSIWVFGSRAKGSERRYSDVDLLLQLESGKGLSDLQLFAMRDALEESALPYKFDLVRAEDLETSFQAKVNLEKIKVATI